MACINCKIAQENDIVSYVRIGNANVLVSGCDKHLNEMFELLGGRHQCHCLGIPDWLW